MHKITSSGLRLRADTLEIAVFCVQLYMPVIRDFPIQIVAIILHSPVVCLLHPSGKAHCNSTGYNFFCTFILLTLLSFLCPFHGTSVSCFKILAIVRLHYIYFKHTSNCYYCLLPTSC
jgi:hypothetical protein